MNHAGALDLDAPDVLDCYASYDGKRGWVEFIIGVISGVARDLNPSSNFFHVNPRDCDPLDASSASDVCLDVDAGPGIVQSDVFDRYILNSARGLATDGYSGKWGRSCDAADGDVTAWMVVGNAILIPTALHCNKVIPSGYVGIFYTYVRA